MKTLFITMLAIMASIHLQASQVLWVGIDDNAKIHVNQSEYTMLEWANEIGQDMVNVGARITVGGDPMPAGYEDPSGYIPPGQSAPTIFFDDPVWGIAYEFGVGMVDNNDEWTGDYADWQPIRLDNTDKSAEIIFELGYWDDNYDFVSLAIEDDIKHDFLLLRFGAFPLPFI